MATKIVCLVLAFSCGAFSAPQVYQATGVEHREAGRVDDIALATSEILPEITSAFQQLSSAQARSNPSDSSSIENTLSAFIPLSRKVLLATAKAEGSTVPQEQLERLNAAERVMPSVFKFMEEMRGLTFDSRTAGVPASRSQNIHDYQPTGVLTPDSGNYQGMAAATMELLPELGTIFASIGSDLGRSDPNDPEFVQRMISAFMPFTKRALLASAKAEGRVVQQEELDRLDAAEAVMPSVFKFMDTLRENDFFGTQTPAAFRTSAPQSLPSAFGSVKSSSLQLQPPSGLAATAQVLPSASSTYKRPTSALTPTRVFSTKSAPSASQRLASPASTVQAPQVPVVYQTAPNYPEISHVSMPQIYQAYIPAVPSAQPGLTYYTYSTSLGRR